jgi:hypothetical protein
MMRIGAVEALGKSTGVLLPGARLSDFVLPASLTTSARYAAYQNCNKVRIATRLDSVGRLFVG